MYPPPPPLHNVLDPRVCAYFRQSARVIGLKHDAERGQPRASVYTVVWTSWASRPFGSVIGRLSIEMTCALWTLTSAFLGFLDEICLGGCGAQAIGSGESGDISLDLFCSPKYQRLIKYVFPYIQAISQLCYRGLWDRSVESSNIAIILLPLKVEREVSNHLYLKDC